MFTICVQFKFGRFNWINFSVCFGKSLHPTRDVYCYCTVTHNSLTRRNSEQAKIVQLSRHCTVQMHSAAFFLIHQAMTDLLENMLQLIGLSNFSIFFFVASGVFLEARFSTPEILLYFSLQHPLHTWMVTHPSANHAPSNFSNLTGTGVSNLVLQ